VGQLLTVGDVAKLLGVSRDRVVQLDGELRPDRTASGVRLFRRELVDMYAGARAQRQNERRRNR
jgi:excisionase family DNA binding protein